MDKKVFLAVAVCAAIFLFWQNVYLKPYAEQQASATSTQQTSDYAGSQSADSNASMISSKQSTTNNAESSSNKTVKLGNETFNVVISATGGRVVSANLDEYRGQDASKLKALVGGQNQLVLSTPSPEWQYLSDVGYRIESQGKNKEGQEYVVLGYEDDKVSLRRTYTLRSDIFSVDHEISANFKQQAPSYLFVDLRAEREISKELSENERREVLFQKSGSPEKWAITDIDEVTEDLGNGNWVGIGSRYFLNALVNLSEDKKPVFQARPLADGRVAASFIYRVGDSSFRAPVRLFYGPKDVDVLSKAGKTLKAAVDFGWFSIFAYPMLSTLKWFYKYIHNFGVAIILLTLLVKIITYPLTLKSMKSMKEMQRIQPQLARLREKHKDDKERLNQEMLQLMRANGYNPMSGCLPILIQMPIFIALYNVLYGAIDLYGEPFFGWIHDLSAKDPLYVTPVLLALMMFVQQKLTPNTASDPAQQRMMMMMPVIFGVMMLWLPAGLTLYMLVNSVVSIIQQFWMNRTLGIGRNAGASAAA